MPYYKEINLLFIHIPKTGGTYLEKYLKERYTQTLHSNRQYLNIYSLFGIPYDLQRVSLQHLSLQVIKKYENKFKLDFNNINIISIVRNPYNRIISDLFWYNIIDENTKPDEITDIIREYINDNKYDDHNIPQYKFLLNDENELDDKIKIFKTETLTEELHNYGFEDYEWDGEITTYYHLLTDDSIDLINEYYREDFRIFNYEMIEV